MRCIRSIRSSKFPGLIGWTDAFHAKPGCWECCTVGFPPSSEAVTRLLDGKVAVVTGSGRGIGRGHALELAKHGAKVVINAPGRTARGEPEPEGASNSADEVVELITSRGGEAVANYADVGDLEQARTLVDQAVETWGRLDIFVNNAGFHRPNPIVDMPEEDWDAVVRVHLKGTFNTTQQAGRYWRSQAEAHGPGLFSLINTTSMSGITLTRPGGSSYTSSKAAINAFTVISSLELAQYGVRVNAISPTGYTRMAASISGASDYKETNEYTEFEPQDPGNNAPLVAWLASDDSDHVSGQVFWIGADTIRLIHGWRSVAEIKNLSGRWEPIEIGKALNQLVFKCQAPEMDSFASMQLGDPMFATWPPEPPRPPTAEDDISHHVRTRHSGLHPERTRQG
jgi:NAD(P)-dependent dehydrogenase (short-subunit alcohol dehydrogenase family)